MTLSKYPKRLRIFLASVIAKVDELLQPCEARVKHLLFGHHLDPVALVVGVFTLARDASFMQALGWIPPAASTDPAWQSAATLFASAVNFWALVMPPVCGMVWLTGAAALILSGLVLGNEKQLLMGIVAAMSFWYCTTAIIWIHLGALPAIQAAGIVAVLSSWVFGQVYHRQHDREFKVEQTEAGAALLGQFVEVMELTQSLKSRSDAARQLTAIREVTAPPQG